MSGNRFGKLFSVTTFGESHGAAIGGVIDGVPANFVLDTEAVQLELDKRKPGQSAIVTQRKESDVVTFLSGIFEGKTTGSPIGFMIQNEDQKSKDYSHIQHAYRPSHADYTYDKKYGHRDYRGGGRSSARETAARVVAGAVAKQILGKIGIQIITYVDHVGEIKLTDSVKIDIDCIENNPVRCPNIELAEKMEALIKTIRKQGDTIGGAVTCRITGVPVGLGEPVFDKLHADLGKAMLSINAVKGFEYGSGFDGIAMRGSEHNDEFLTSGKTKSNFSGGIQGGITNGEEIYFRVAFKPVATIMQDQNSIDDKGEEVIVKGRGRHDPCVVPRAVPIVSAMAALVILDHYLIDQSKRIF
ncbi:MAG: chorismate synthase [Crocinitomicaceae bacterium]|nr:chorismate synthase [Crocinitomicaceae bacterium]